MNKYIDLIGQITERLDVPYGNIRLGIHEALAYLDRYPERVPGRTMTAGEVGRRSHLIRGDVEIPSILDFLDALGITVTPDPVPTNAEKLPGRTITESDLIDAVDETNHEDMNKYQKARALLVHLGYTIPKPEPTSSKKLANDIEEWGMPREAALNLATWLVGQGW